MSEFRYDVFISYARRDGWENAVRLEKELADAGFTTWRDTRGIDPAKDFTAEIDSAIAASSLVVACITPDTLRDNSFVRRELQYALLSQKPVIVARMDADTLPPIHVIDNTWIEFYKGWAAAFAKVEDILHQSERDYRQPKLRVEATDPFREYVQNLYERSVDFLNRAVIEHIELRSLPTEGAVEASLKRTFRRDMFDQLFLRRDVAEPHFPGSDILDRADL